MTTRSSSGSLSQEFCETVNLWRRFKGMTVREFSDKSGLSMGFLSQAFNGKQLNIRFESAVAMAMALDMDFDPRLLEVPATVQLTNAPQKVPHGTPAPSVSSPSN